MRFMIIRKADAATEAGVPPSEDLLSQLGAYLANLVKAGVFLGGEGLRPSSDGVRVRFEDGAVSVVPGPFAATKELVAGYSLIQAKSLEEALEWVRRWPVLDGDGNVQIEVRQVFEAADFGPAPRA